MKRLECRNPYAHRRGVALVLVAASLVTLLLFASLAVDVGYICALTAEQQNTADAGALAGASGLQDDDWVAAQRRALDVIARNQIPQGFLSLDDQIIEFGWWDSVRLTFHPLDDLDHAFATRVRAARNNAPLFFAALMGKHSTDVSRQAVAVGSKPCGGIWGLEGVTVPGHVMTDSYNSTEGAYDEPNAYSNGDICSGRQIDVRGSVDVNGDAMAGMGYMVDVKGGPIITGITTATLDGVEPPLVDFGDVAYENDNDRIGLTDRGNDPFVSDLGLVIHSYDNLTLAEGTYYLGSIMINADASLSIDGPVTLYMTGNLIAGGDATINTTENPADLTIISTGSMIKLTGGAEFYGTILAPNAEVRLGGSSDYYGAIVGKTVKMSGNFAFHVDESLELSKPWFEPPPPMLVK